MGSSSQHGIKLSAEGVGKPHLQATATESLAKGWHQFLVELEGQHTVEAVKQRPGQGSAARTDLEHPRRIVGQQRGDALGDLVIDQEILA